MMAGKASVFLGAESFYAVDHLSKNTLIDFVADLARAELGEAAGDSHVLLWIQRKIEATHRARGQKSIDLIRLLGKFLHESAKYRAEHGL